MNHVFYNKCKNCEHYGVLSDKCWNEYECPKEKTDYIPYSIRKLYAHANEKEEKINAENESLSKAEREAILNELSIIKRQCSLIDGSNYNKQSRQYIYNAANEIECIIKHKK